MCIHKARNTRPDKVFIYGIFAEKERDESANKVSFVAQNHPRMYTYYVLIKIWISTTDIMVLPRCHFFSMYFSFDLLYFRFFLYSSALLTDEIV